MGRLLEVTLMDVVIILGLTLVAAIWFPEALPWSVLGFVVGNRVAAVWPLRRR